MNSITCVDRGSPLCGRVKINDRLLSINGHAINDLLDYLYYSSDVELTLEFEGEAGVYSRRVIKEKEDDLGLSFDSYLMDDKKRCCNKCIFCFIDQLPQGLRESLYFKDDDARLSLMSGNYITLTNLSEEDIKRIIELRISPINISVHSADPETRVFMMRNRHAGDCLAIMRRFAQAGIVMNAQIVLCKGINDGDRLTQTIDELFAMGDSVKSLSVVPAGLTRFREGLFPLEPFLSLDALFVIEQIEERAKGFRNIRGDSFVYAADEFYIKAGVEIPKVCSYDGFPQLENGVGMLAQFMDEFRCALKFCDPAENTPCTIVTGEASYPYIKALVSELTTLCGKVSCEVVMVKNNFFGGHITVSGLVTGSDIAQTLKGKEIKRLLLPENMLRNGGDLFLDGMTPDGLAELLDTEITVVPNDGGTLLDAILEV